MLLCLNTQLLQLIYKYCMLWIYKYCYRYINTAIHMYKPLQIYKYCYGYINAVRDMHKCCCGSRRAVVSREAKKQHAGTLLGLRDQYSDQDER